MVIKCKKVSIGPPRERIEGSHSVFGRPALIDSLVPKPQPQSHSLSQLAKNSLDGISALPICQTREPRGINLDA
jgi:hypothetical protein